MNTKNIVIIGGGIIGLSIGWQLVKRNFSVTIFDKDSAGQSASWTAAGMLSPLAEVNMQEKDLLQLGLTSAELYPGWVDELETDSQMSVEFQTEGTLIVALDRDDDQELRHHFDLQKLFNLPVEWLDGRSARNIEPALSPRVVSAISCDSDFQVDNRLVIGALKYAFQKFGGNLHEHVGVDRIEISDGTAVGVWTGDNLVKADQIIVSAGCWSALIEGIPGNLPVRPVKGQMLALQMEDPQIVRKVIHAPDAYLVPKRDGRLLIGATSEEQGFDTQITAGGIFELLRGAWEVLPGIYDFPIIETWVGLRPGSRDNAPILGKTEVENLILATGHFRKGILLAPITAQEICSLIMTDHTSDIIAPFTPARWV